MNSGRRALEYILRRLGGVRRVHVPLYTCGTVLEPMERLHIPVIPYRIDGHLEPEELPELEEGEFLLYTNYFGIKEKYVDRLASRYGGRLVVDNALALYSPARPGVASLYSPRKFPAFRTGESPSWTQTSRCRNRRNGMSLCRMPPFCWDAWNVGRKGLPPPADGTNGGWKTPPCGKCPV